MLDKKIVIIAIQERYLDIIAKQVKEILGDKVPIQAITVKDLRSNTIRSGDIVLISNNKIKGVVTQLIPEDCPVIVGKREINYTNTSELTSLPPGQKILVVNDNKRNTDETVQSLQEIVFEHDYHAYRPEEAISSSFDYIVTPGERHLLPKELANVIDVGSRLLDISTFEEIYQFLNIDYQITKMVKRYFKACVSLSGESKKKTGSRDIRNVAQYQFSDFVADSQLMQAMIKKAKLYSKNADIGYIHIEGKAGTGKSMLAEAIHNYSSLSDQPYISINCASKSFDLVEKELFGSEGDGKVSTGLFELAQYGTVCIKEVGALPLSLQQKLYDVLASREFSRLDSEKVIPLQVRVITTNSNDSREMTENGILFDKLFQLFNTCLLEVPSLSERLEEFPSLVEKMKQRINRTDIGITDEVIDYLKSYHWESNVKELFNVITYLSFIEESPITISSLPFYLQSKANKEKQNQADLHLEVIRKIEEHGFLEESIEILQTFHDGKKQYTSYGRNALRKRLMEKGLTLSEQQLRIRLEVLQNLELTIVRQGRAGSTISRKGEAFIKDYTKKLPVCN